MSVMSCTNFPTLGDTDGANSLDSRNSRKLLLAWENLTVTVNRQKSISTNLWEKLVGKRVDSRPVKILNEVSGYAESGQMVAIMGPSGAGKTTLLAALSRLTEPASGSIRLNGAELSKRVMSKIGSYVPQFDPLPVTLTVAEYVSFACALKLAKSTEPVERALLTMRIIEELGLVDCRDVLISRISGGERKRASIAAEIITRPSILFLDEPTTGLDSCAALRVVQSLKIATARSITLCSIHQPGIALYNLFSHVLFLTEGRTAFFGSLSDARIFFQSEGYVCPRGFDEVEYYIKTISLRHAEDSEIVRLRDVEKICDAYVNSGFFHLKIPQGPTAVQIVSTEMAAGRLTQFNWLLWRIYLENRRTIMNGLIAFQYYAMAIVLIGIFYIGTDSHSQSGVRDVMGLLYMTSTELVYSSAYTVLHQLRENMPIYLRERGFYGPTAYYLAVVFSWIPKVMLKALVLTVLLSIILKYEENAFFTYFQYFLISTGCSICSAAYGIMISSHIDREDVASAIMVPIDLLALIMAGIFYHLKSPTLYTGVLKYLSIFHYAHEMLSIIHWSNVGRIECDVDRPCFHVGSDVLTDYGYKKEDFWTNALGLTLLTIFMHLIGFLGVRRRRIVKLML